MNFGAIARIRSLAFIWLALLLGYNNCGFRTYKAVHNVENAELSACELELQAKYQASYYATLFSGTGACSDCHNDLGDSPYKFGSSDIKLAYSTFKRVGVDRIETNALKESHAAGRTGPANQEAISNLRTQWDSALEVYDSCMNNDNPVGNDALRLDDRITPELYFGDGRTVALSWDLQAAVTPRSRALPAMFTIDVSVTYEADGDKKRVTGYSFSNPRLRMLVGEIEAEIEGIIVYVNGAKLAGLEQLASARKTARGIDPAVVFEGKASAELPSVANSDKISIAFGYLEIRDRTDTPPTPTSPSLTLAGGSGFTNAAAEVPAVIGSDMSARRWCVTFAPGRPDSANDPCPGFTGQGPIGWSTARPTRVLLATLGRLPANGETLTASIWVANSDLVMNIASPAATVVYDALRPDAPVFTGFTADMSPTTGMPVAEIIELADGSEPVNWCVKEFATGTNTPNSDGCTFTTLKPRYVGLKGSGSRSVVVFARDRAGNISNASMLRSVDNTLARITFTQLTTAGTARGVFATSCASCHGSGSRPWNSASYASSVAQKANLLKVSSGDTTPAGHSGYLGERERVLLRTWLTQTSTPVEQ